MDVEHEIGENKKGHELQKVHGLQKTQTDIKSTGWTFRNDEDAINNNSNSAINNGDADNAINDITQSVHSA